MGKQTQVEPSVFDAMPIGHWGIAVAQATKQPSSICVYALFAISGLSAGTVERMTLQDGVPTTVVPVNAVAHAMLFGAGVTMLSGKPPCALVMPLPPVRHFGVQ